LPRSAHHRPIAPSLAACAAAPAHPALPGRRAASHAPRISPPLPQRPHPQLPTRRPVPRCLPHPKPPGSWRPLLPAPVVRRVQRSSLPSGPPDLPQAPGLPRGRISQPALPPGSSVCS
jgi:hypothetical protein